MTSGLASFTEANAWVHLPPESFTRHFPSIRAIWQAEGGQVWVEAEAVWLDPTIQDPARLLPLLKPYPAEKMEAYPVSARVNNPSHDGPECIEPLGV